MSGSQRALTPVWVVLAAGVAAAMHVGKLPPALPALAQDVGITLVQAGFLLSLVQLAGMTLGLAVGLSVDGLGLRRSMIAGLLLLAAASLLGGWARSPQMLLTLRALEGMGFLLVLMPAPSLIRQLAPPERLSVMLGFWGAYMPMGTAVALLTGPLVIALCGWQAWWWLLGVVALGVAWCVAVVVPGDAARMAVLAPARAAEPGAWRRRLRRTLSAPGPWLVALAFAMYSGQWLAVVGFLPTIYAQAGVSAAASAPLTALAAGANIVGNIVAGRLLAKGAPAHRLLFAGFAVMGLGALLAFATAPMAPGGVGLPAPGRFVAVALFSMVGGMIPSTLFFLSVRLAPGEDAVSTTVGWAQQWSALGQFAGAPLVAWLASLVGGWHWTWAVTGLCSVIGIALAVGLRAQLAHVR